MRLGISLFLLAEIPSMLTVSAMPATASVRPDFSTVTSHAAAERLAIKGTLVEVLLFPSELGGADAPENRAYITPEAANARNLIIGTLLRFLKDGLIDKMTVAPEYKGDSLVPSRIVMRATSKRKKGSFEPVIEVW